MLSLRCVSNPTPHSTLEFIFGIANSVGFDKCLMTCICHYNVIQNSFTALKILYALCLHPSFLETPGNHESITVLVAFSRMLYRVIQTCSLSDWLCYIHLRFLYVFSWLDGSFIFSAELYSAVWMCYCLLIYSSTSQLLPSWFSYQ